MCDPQKEVNLVPRDAAPRGLVLVDSDRVGKKNQFDLVELAAQVGWGTDLLAQTQIQSYA